MRVHSSSVTVFDLCASWLTLRAATNADFRKPHESTHSKTDTRSPLPLNEHKSVKLLDPHHEDFPSSCSQFNCSV